MCAKISVKSDYSLRSGKKRNSDAFSDSLVSQDGDSFCEPKSDVKIKLTVKKRKVSESIVELGSEVVEVEREVESTLE